MRQSSHPLHGDRFLPRWCARDWALLTQEPRNTLFSLFKGEDGFMYNQHELNKWSRAEKKAARDAFDLAMARELKSLRAEVERMLGDSRDDRVIWQLEDYLYEARRDFDRKYDYRYSVLMLVFSRLVSEGWLTLEELSGIGANKVESIRRIHEF